VSNVPTYDEVMTLTGTVSNHHVLQLPESQAMYDAVCSLPDRSTLVEVGCDYGRSSSLFYQVAKAKNLLTIHVDPWLDEPFKAKMWMEVMSERAAYHPFILLRMKTQEAEQLIGVLTPQGIDLAYIDGCHDYPVVVEDLRIVAERVKVGGLLLVHDYPSAGVDVAVDRYIDRGGWTIINHAMGLGIWRRG
jgi:predicted O-methyltransferase YrrM